MKQNHNDKDDAAGSPAAFQQQHYSPEELGKLWHVSGNTVRRWCDEVGGILAIDRPERMNKRGYKTIRIPESTAAKIYARYFEAAA